MTPSIICSRDKTDSSVNSKHQFYRRGRTKAKDGYDNTHKDTHCYFKVAVPPPDLILIKKCLYIEQATPPGSPWEKSGFMAPKKGEPVVLEE